PKSDWILQPDDSYDFFPAAGEPQRAADDADHAVGLRKISPQLAAHGRDVFREKAERIAALEQSRESLARFVDAARRRQRIHVPERADRERVLRMSEVVRVL